jgi:hypothetical protein
MHRLILLGAVAAFLSIAGLAAADSTTASTAHANAVAARSAGASHRPGFGPNRGRHLHWFAGSVSAVGDGSLAVGVLWTGPNDGYLNGQTVNLAVPTSSRISQGKRHRPIALAQIQANDLVAVRASGDSASDLVAYKIHDMCNCHWIGGTVGTVGTTSFTVNATRTGPYDTVLDNTTVTLQVSADTVYLRGPHRGRIGLADLRPGEGVGVVFGANGFFKAPGFNPQTATFTAERAHVWGRGSVPQPSSDASDAANVAD